MRGFPLILLGLAACTACAAPKPRIRYSEGFDPAAYRRVGVLPFTDRQGRGRQISQDVAVGLPTRGFTVVDTRSLSNVLAHFRPDAEVGLGITELTEIKTATRAQALLSGAVDPEGRQATVVMIDTELGDELLHADLFPAHKGPYAGAKEISDQVLALFAPETPKK